MHAMAGKGGILGDDMGLGKTLQCAAFLAGLLNSRLARRVLVIAPVTLLAQWSKELQVVGLASQTHRYYGDSVAQRDLALRTIMKDRGVLLTTYGMVLHNAGLLRCPAASRGSYSRRGGGDESEDFQWDAMMLDEGHKIKNPKMKLVQELRTIPAKTRVIISGTPIQNNLMELHALVDFCAEGVLGDARYFKRMYEKPILRGQDSGATGREKEVGGALAKQLRQRMAPYFLRREKASVMSEAAAASAAEDAADAAAFASGTARSTSSGAARIQQLGHKNDLVVWLRLRPLQQSIYRAFLASDAVKRALNETDSPLSALVVLKKIADHPGLLSQRATSAVIDARSSWAARDGQESGSEEESDSGDSIDSFIDDADADDDFIDDGSDASGDERASSARRRAAAGRPVKAKKQEKKQPRAKPKPSKASALLEEEEGQTAWNVDGANIESLLLSDLESRGADASCKTVFVLALLEELARGGHRTLIFSQSRVMLDILQAGIKARSMSMLRIDGTVARADERQAIVQRFQTTPSIAVLLLTSQVGGLGLTLTEADRVIIVDPNWNPSIDNQSVDRAYRIGQRKDVVVYRLITCGTVEEKIYQRQVFKGGLSRTGTEEGVQFRYFTNSDLRDLFQISDEGLQTSVTHTQLSQLHARQRKASPAVASHLQFLESLEGCAGISDHDLLFSQKLVGEGSLSKEDEAQLLDESERSAVAAAAAPLPPRRAAAPNGTKAHRAAAAQAAAELAAKMSDTLLLGRPAGGSSAAPGGPAAAGAAAAVDGQEEGKLLLAARRRAEALSHQHKAQLATYQALRATLADGGAKMLKRVDEIDAELHLAQAQVRRLQGAMAAALEARGAPAAAATTAAPEGGPHGSRGALAPPANTTTAMRPSASGTTDGTAGGTSTAAPEGRTLGEFRFANAGRTLGVSASGGASGVPSSGRTSGVPTLSGGTSAVGAGGTRAPARESGAAAVAVLPARNAAATISSGHLPLAGGMCSGTPPPPCVAEYSGAAGGTGGGTTCAARNSTVLGAVAAAMLQAAAASPLSPPEAAAAAATATGGRTVIGGRVQARVPRQETDKHVIDLTND